MEITASYYDGKTSQQKDVRIHFDAAEQIRITGLENVLTYSLSEVRISSRVGNTPRSLLLPGGAKCETLDNETIDAILRLQGRGRWHAFLHILESRLPYVVLALVLSILGIWGSIQYGIPALAKQVAYALPESTNAALGREGLKFLDRVLFAPSLLEQAQQRRLASLLQEMTEGLDEVYDFQLEFRKSDRVGPNAFALPSGTIVVTDDLVLLAEHDNEIIAVLAHEIGHVIHRHTLRSVLQNSSAILIVAGVTGDVTSISALSSALPTLLMEAKYSRAFEREADRFALQYLRAQNIPTTHFADLLVRLKKETGYESGVHNYLASHPATNDRIQRFRGEE